MTMVILHDKGSANLNEEMSNAKNTLDIKKEKTE